jgi:diaminopimelate epimerase
VAYYQYKIDKPVSLHTKGGEELKVDFDAAEGAVSNLSLTGPAKVTFSGSFFINDFF